MGVLDSDMTSDQIDAMVSAGRLEPYTEVGYRVKHEPDCEDRKERGGWVDKDVAGQLRSDCVYCGGPVTLTGRERKNYRIPANYKLKF